MRRKISTVALFALAFLGVVYARVLWEARDEVHQAKEWVSKGDLDEALVHYRRAAHWYAPINPWVGEALDALAALGTRAERAGEIERALSAWRAIRGSILGTRSFYTPTPERLDRANRHIARLMAKQPRPAADQNKEERALAEEHLALLRKDDSPSVFWSIVLLLGFFGWVGSAFGFIYRGLDAEGRLIRVPALRWALGIVGGVGLWILGMFLA